MKPSDLAKAGTGGHLGALQYWFFYKVGNLVEIPNLNKFENCLTQSRGFECRASVKMPEFANNRFRPPRIL